MPDAQPLFTRTDDQYFDVTIGPVCQTVLDSYSRLRIAGASIREATGLDITPGSVIFLVNLRTSEGQVNMGQLAEMSGMSRGNLSNIASHAVKMGWVLDGQRSEPDRRQIVLQLTDKGRQLADRLMAV